MRSKTETTRDLCNAIAWFLNNGDLKPETAARHLRLVASIQGNAKPLRRAEPRQKPETTDELDKKISQALRQDPNAPYWQIAARVGCDQARVAERMRRRARSRSGSTGTRKPPPVFELPDELAKLLTAWKQGAKS